MALKEEDQIKERIRYNTELIKLFVVFLIATGGGVLTLIIGEIDSGREVVLTAGGNDYCYNLYCNDLPKASIN